MLSPSKQALSASIVRELRLNGCFERWEKELLQSIRESVKELETELLEEGVKAPYASSLTKQTLDPASRRAIVNKLRLEFKSLSSHKRLEKSIHDAFSNVWRVQMDVEKRITDEYHKQARDAYDLPDLKRGPESLPDPRETKKRKIQEVEEGEIVDDD